MPILPLLPDELLLGIAADLCRSDLCNLALACRRTAPVAQKALYTEIDLFRRKNSSQIVYLAQTLLDRPDIATMVRKLQMTVGYPKGSFVHREPAMPYREACKRVIRSLEIVQKSRKAWSTRTKEWLNELRVGYDSAWAGIILCLVPNLHSLYFNFRNLHPEEIDPRRKWKDMSPLYKLFGRDSEFDLSVIPGLRNLTDLYYSGEEIPSSWFRLPSLQDVELDLAVTPDLDQIRLADPSPLQTNQLDTLSLITTDAHLFLYEFNSFPIDGLSWQFLNLRNFPSLETLILRYTDIEFDALSSRRQGNCANLFTRPGAVSHALRHFEIWWYSGPHYTHLTPIPLQLAETFNKLLRVALPQQLLLGRQFSARLRSNCHTPLTSVLPSSIQTLEISDPTQEIRRWLEELLRVKTSFPHLEAVTFHIYRERGNIREDEHEVWTRLDDAGIFCCVADDEGYQWAPWSERAEGVADVAGWLERLDEPEDRTVVGLGQFWDLVENCSEF
ncbi:hypothetical protein K458DRAFT_395991 [Lentithecium fluviatile CBS 122367]|uniref:Uncharacterized protein n=1 Tax=Lentithecium fluviatile CBS 122367 TaxID=1168545 RepID=A0A6G1IGY8_9PLEO|nr:hypothetical protein K458DRAFT_395991 [Lentithecium fluviatile CBS 122367]